MPTANDYLQMTDGTWKLKSRLGQSNLETPIYSEELRNTNNIKANSRIESSSQSFTQASSQPFETKKPHLKIMTAEDLMKQPTDGSKLLWGSFIYEKCIILLSGDAGVGKTTLAYNLAIQAAKGGEFCSIPFSRSLNVLYCDLETGAALRKSKVMLISDNSIPDTLYFITDLNFIDQLNELLEIVHEKDIDLVVVDTINEAFGTKDEQDNAEANRQFKAIKRLRDEGNCSILLMHHIGKGEQTKGVYSARGASARAGAADVVLTLRATTEDTICLQKEKDRIGGGKDKIYLKKAGEDCFEIVEQGEDQEVPLIIRAEKFVLELCDNNINSRIEFLEQGRTQGFSRPTIDRALTNLRNAGELVSPRRGIYSRPLNVTKETPREEGEHSSPLLKAYSGKVGENNLPSEYSGKQQVNCLAHKEMEQELGITKEEIIALWKKKGAPVIHINSGENCFDLEKLLSNGNISRSHVDAIGKWINKEKSI